MEEEPRGAPVLPPALSLVGGGPGGGVGLGLGVPCGGGPVGLGGALGVELPVADGTTLEVEVHWALEGTLG